MSDIQHITLGLTLKDRIALKDILPTEGGYLEFLLIKGIQNRVELTAEDISRCKIRQVDGGIVWDVTADKPVDFELTVEQFDILVQSGKRMDSEKKVNDNNVEVIHKIFAINDSKQIIR